MRITIDRRGKQPLLRLATTQPVSEPFLELQNRWDDAIETIVLEPLKRFAASALIKAHLPIDGTLAQRLAQHTGGNPRPYLELWSRADDVSLMGGSAVTRPVVAR